MPIMDGDSATRALRQEKGFQGPIIGVTGDVVHEDQETFMKSGLNLVLTKPVNFSKLVKALQDHGIVVVSKQDLPDGALPGAIATERRNGSSNHQQTPLPGVLSVQPSNIFIVKRSDLKEAGPFPEEFFKDHTSSVDVDNSEKPM
jgi:hypothetical protein